MKRSITLLRLVAVPAASLLAVLALGACGTDDPNPGMTGGTGGNSGTGGSASGGRGGSGATGGTSMGGSGGSATGGSGGSGSGGTGGSVDGPPTGMGEYFPFKIGNRWVYEVTEAGNNLTYRKEHVVVRMEAVMGTGMFKDKSVFRVETRKASAGNPNMLDDATISWQIKEGSKILRYRETSCARLTAVLMNGAISSCDVDVEDYWNPARVRIDELPMGMALTKGSNWDERYTEYKNSYNRAVTPPVVTMSMVANTDSWFIMEVGVPTTVKAGTFNDCLVVQKKTNNVSPTIKTYTFCRGVGKVLEVGSGQREELVELPTLR